MSHFVKIRTQIREREHLVAALRDLHYQFQVGENLVVRGFADGTERAEVVVNTGSKYDIGFRRTADQYEVVADWWLEHSTPIRQQTFLQDLSQRYAYNVTMAQAVKQDDLIFESEQTLENGDVVLLFSERG